MEINRSKVKRLALYVIRNWFGVLCVGFIVYMCFVDDYCVLNIMRLRAQESELEHDIERYKDSIAAYQRRIDELSVESQELERVAREQMHMHKKNEDLYLFDD